MRIYVETGEKGEGNDSVVLNLRELKWGQNRRWTEKRKRMFKDVKSGSRR